MSEENVEAFKRAIDAGNSRDWESFLETLDPEVEWHPGLAASLEGEATVPRPASLLVTLPLAGAV